jgi:hypothetical protein
MLPAGGPVSLQLRVDYQEVNGFSLPRRLTFSGNDGHQLVMMDLSFGNCQTVRR